MTSKIKIGKEVKGLNPYFYRGKELSNIIFFRDNKILYESTRGWLEPIHSITINEPKQANKIDLNRQYNFYVPCKDIYKRGSLILYVYVDNKEITISEPVEEIDYQTEYEINYRNKYTLKIDCTKYHYVKNNKDEFIKIEKPVHEIDLTKFSRIELKEKGNAINELEKELKDLNIDINYYSLKKLYENYTITRKGK
jgi:hypothetical protein